MHIERYKAGDEAKIIDLFLKSFGKPINYEFWKWRYLNNPFTSRNMINLMWDNDVLAGHYAVFPVEMVIDKKITLSALSMTTMTNPEYTGKGIFKNLAEDLYYHINKNENVSIVWGFPNLNSHYGFIKNLSWKDIGTIPTLKLNERHFNKISLKSYTLIGDFIQLHADKIKSLQTGVVTVNKTHEYLKWRYNQNPVNNYHIIETGDLREFAVIKMFSSFNNPGRQEIDILEHGYNPDGGTQSIIGAILQYAADMKSDICSINTWIPLHDPRHIQLEKLNFTLDTPVTFVGYRPLNDKLIPSSLNDWNITMGDSDIY